MAHNEIAEREYVDFFVLIWSEWPCYKELYGSRASPTQFNYRRPELEMSEKKCLTLSDPRCQLCPIEIALSADNM